MFVEKKDFNVYEFEKEEAYLNQKAEQGFFLIDYNQNGYVFEKENLLQNNISLSIIQKSFTKKSCLFTLNKGLS